MTKSIRVSLVIVSLILVLLADKVAVLPIASVDTTIVHRRAGEGDAHRWHSYRSRHFQRDAGFTRYHLAGVVPSTYVNTDLANLWGVLPSAVHAL